MSPTSQPGLHLDVDILNAFVEHALPEAERVRVVAHMADCARCREVVYQARAAAEPEIAPAPVKAVTQPGWFSSAFAKWRVALIPAAALATVGGTILWVQLHPRMEQGQMAKAAPPTALPAPKAAAPALSLSPMKDVAPLAKQPDELVAARTKPDSIPKSAQAERMPEPDQKQSTAPADGLIAMSNAASNASRPAALGSAIHLDGRSAAMARSAQRPQSPAAPPMPAFSAPHPADAQTPVTSAAAQYSAAAPAPSAVPQMSPTAGLELSQLPTQSAPDTEISSQQLHGLALMRLAGRPRLPSGLATVSSATLLNRLVALDAAGGLFLSEDGGMHWITVHTSWNGKAVEVSAATMTVSQNLFRPLPAQKAQGPELTALSARPVDNAPPPPAPPAEGSSGPMTASTKTNKKPALPVLPPLFKLLTDRHQVWVSADGKLWQRQ